MNRDLRRYASPAYWVGLGGLVAAAVWYFYRAEFDVVLRIALAVAAVGGAAGVLLDPERVRRTWRTRQARYGSNALLLSVSVGGILLLLNVAAARSTARLDLTEDQQFSLSPESLLVLAELPGPAQLKGFYTPDLVASRDGLRPLLDEYVARSGGKLSYDFVDPNEDPLSAQRYGVTRDGSIVVILGDRTEVVTIPDEQEITSALVRLANPGERAVYFLTGHGEPDLEGTEDAGFSRLRDALVAKSYEVGSLNLLADHVVPDGALAIVIAGARQPLAADEIETLQAFSNQGGGLVVLAQPIVEIDLGDTVDPLGQYLAESWHINLSPDVVVDLGSNQTFYGIASRYAPHSITDKLQGIVTYYPVARSLTLGETGELSRRIQPLVETSDQSWGEVDPATLAGDTQFRFDEGVDQPGPLTLAAAGEDAATGARLVVFGDSDFATNGFLLDRGNSDIVVNSIDWAAGQDSLINLTPRDSTQRIVVPPTGLAQRLILVLTVFAIPGIVLILGVRMAWERRRRA
ncbi:MAG: GldG family protein [Anaerolineales bacterium]